MNEQRLGRRQKAVLSVMYDHGGVWPYPTRYADRLILHSLEKRGIVKFGLDLTWRVVK